MERNFFFLVAISIFLSACSVNSSGEECKENVGEKNVALSLVCWNVQTFFDAETDGSEYSDFQSAGKWSKDKYLVRLHRLCDVMRELNADVYVFEEIENEAVIYDISNQLIGNDWSSKNKWHYACFAKEDGASIGCAVISKFGLSGVRTHNIDVRVMREGQPSVRPLVEVTVNAGNNELVLYCAHWKSKLGDEDLTDVWRDWQEALLARQILDNGNAAVVMCGDFNRDADEFVLDFDGNDRTPNTILRTMNGEGELCVKVYNPWFNSDGTYATEIGSYFYENEWERIDQVMTYGSVKLSAFSPKAEEPWANERGIPIGYKIYTGEGYSDHLPMMCTLVFGNQK